MYMQKSFCIWHTLFDATFIYAWGYISVTNLATRVAGLLRTYIYTTGIYIREIVDQYIDKLYLFIYFSFCAMKNVEQVIGSSFTVENDIKENCRKKRYIESRIMFFGNVRIKCIPSQTVVSKKKGSKSRRRRRRRTYKPECKQSLMIHLAAAVILIKVDNKVG